MRLLWVLLVVVSAATLPANAMRFNVLKTSRGTMSIVNEMDPRFTTTFTSPTVLAIAEYNRSRPFTGWDVLHITTNPAAADEDQAYAAGYFEGTQTGQDAVNHYNNYYFTGPPPAYTTQFLINHTVWVNHTINEKRANGTMDTYWRQLELLWLQWEGLLAGMNAQGPIITREMLITLTSLGDMFDLVPGLLQPQERATQIRDWRKMSKPEYTQWFARNTHCSALFKVTGDLQEIFFGHVAWFEYYTMLFIFKHYTLNYNSAGTTAQTISMSSYPGMLSSFDDFYLTSSGLGVIETSLGVMNLTMYNDNLSIDLLLYWERVLLATRMANSGPEWASLLAYRNGGTYSNQWTILDLKLFVPGSDLPDNLLWVAEQLPGVVKSRDVTDILRFGYWPSYNVPYDRELYYLSGYNEATLTQGPEMNDYQMCVRAQIFRRDQGKATDLNSFIELMQYNDYETDPISQQNPVYAIAARGDLYVDSPMCFGGLNGKVSSYRLFKEGQAIHSFSGPTPQQPTFAFNTTAAPDCGPHVGIPEVQNFGWVVQRP